MKTSLLLYYGLVNIQEILLPFLNNWLSLNAHQKYGTPFNYIL